MKTNVMDTNYAINVQRIDKSGVEAIDTSNLPFGKYFSDHMFMADYREGEWTDFRILPFGPVSVSPSMSALHYGQSIFEGMKAYRNDKGELILFRPLENSRRLNRSAERMSMPQVPEKLFMQALVDLLNIDRKWVFAEEGCALYIRPVMFATDDYLGVRASNTYRFIIFTSPTGPYYSEPIKVLIETAYSRACAGGVGFAKAAGNYAASLLPTRLANQKGYHQILWTDSGTHQYIEESGMMNVLFVLNGKLVTPTLDSGTILTGKTRDSIITIARDLDMPVAERRIGVDEIINAIENGSLGEAFGAGTAATVAPIALIGYKGKDYVLPEITDASFAQKVAAQLNAIWKGRVPDKHNWMYRIQ